MMVKKSKIKKPNELLLIRRALKRKGRPVAFTNGCFDILHGGHVRLFREAKKSGDVLIVALNSDASVRKLKGPSRPIFPLKERLEVLAALVDIDYLTWFSEETPRKIIAKLLPDILIKGGDWRLDQVVGRAEVEGAGGKVILVPYFKGHSSTSIIDRIKRLKIR